MQGSGTSIVREEREGTGSMNSVESADGTKSLLIKSPVGTVIVRSEPGTAIEAWNGKLIDVKILLSERRG